MKQLPNAIESEKVVLSATIGNRNVLTELIDKLQPQDFYDLNYQKIWTTILELDRKGKTVDFMSVSETIKGIDKELAMGGNKQDVLLDLGSSEWFGAIEHSERIVDKSKKRKLFELLTRRSEDIFDELKSSSEILEDIEHGIFDLNVSLQDYFHISQLVPESLRMMYEALKSDGLTGIPSGLTNLDRITGGWQRSNLIILAGRPKMGKTSEALHFLISAAQFGHTVGIFSLEMSRKELTDKLLATIAKVDTEKLKKGTLQKDEIQRVERASVELKTLPVYVDDKAGISPFEIKSKVRRMILKHGLELCIVDYLQLIDGKGQSREQEVSYISRSLKGLAKEMNIPIIALAQLNRKADDRTDKRPKLSDLRESGAIEQDADLVILCYRDDYYGIKTDGEGNNIEGMVENIIAANRHGRTGEVFLKYDIDTSTFTNFNEMPF